MRVLRSLTVLGGVAHAPCTPKDAVGLSPLGTPTFEQDSSEEPGQLESPLPAQPPPAACFGAPGLPEEKLLTPFWFCLALVLCHLLVSSGHPTPLSLHCGWDLSS